MANNALVLLAELVPYSGSIDGNCLFRHAHGVADVDVDRPVNPLGRIPLFLLALLVQTEQPVAALVVLPVEHRRSPTGNLPPCLFDRECIDSCAHARSSKQRQPAHSDRAGARVRGSTRQVWSTQGSLGTGDNPGQGQGSISLARACLSAQTPRIRIPATRPGRRRPTAAASRCKTRHPQLISPCGHRESAIIFSKFRSNSSPMPCPAGLTPRAIRTLPAYELMSKTAVGMQIAGVMAICTSHRAPVRSPALLLMCEA